MRSETLGRRTFVSALLGAAASSALGRLPYGGVLRMAVPWPVDGLDPHSIFDPAALFFAGALFDPLYAADAQGRTYSALAESVPRFSKGRWTIRLREGLTTARGHDLDARDVAWSLERARARGARGLLAPFSRFYPAKDDPLAVVVDRADRTLALALASPLTAIVPRTISPGAPDGTGAFVAEPGRRGLLLRRNPRAARGASLLDAIELSHAPDLAAALRAFEAETVDVGWLGAGLHRRRPDAVDFTGPTLGWVALRTGRDAGSWNAPGTAQQLIDGVDPARLGHLGLTDLLTRGKGPRWAGPPAELLVDREAPQLFEIAQVLAAEISGPSPVVAVRSNAAELRARFRDGRFALMLQVVRDIEPYGERRWLGLLQAASPRLAEHPPAFTGSTPRSITRTLSLGAVGRIRPTGAHAARFAELGRWRLGSVWAKRD